MKHAFPFAVAACLAAAAQAEERELGAHVHGQGALNIAFEGDRVLMELEAPGADIVGFEHAAASAEDRAAVDAAVAALAKPLDLFVPDAGAGCVVTAASVELVAEGDAHDEHGHEEHGHDEEAHAGHDHDKEGHAHDEHGREDHAKSGEAGHAEFHAEYALTCADPLAVRTLDFAYFEKFPNAQELDVQLISDKGAKGFEVERDAPRLDLAGAI